jgi:hypothetical protein
MYIEGTNGNVGIGTTAPIAKLNVVNSGSGDTAVFQASGEGGVASHIQNGPNGDIYWRSANPAGKVILQDTGGNVAIGTSFPKGKLRVLDYHVDIFTSVGPSGGFAQDGLTVASNPGAGYSSMVVNSDHTPAGDRGIFKVTRQGISQFYVRGDGNVGIGTTSPNQAKLVVNGTNGSDSIGGHYSYSSEGVVSANSFSGNVGGVSIKASDAIHASIFRAVSDARIKVIEGVSDGAVDLGTLSRIEITNYTYKDVIGKGKNRSKKLIAQQVETVFPQAVSKAVDVVPDIYKRAVIAEGWVELATDLKKGERVRLISDKHDGVHEVLEVEADRFRTAYRPDLKNDSAAPVVATAVDPSVGVQKAADKATAAADVADEKGNPAAGEGHVFVFGREVNDFRAVDYDAISMLNVSATQELLRRLEAKEKEVEELKSHLNVMDEKMVKILALLSADLAKTAKPVSLTSKPVSE